MYYIVAEKNKQGKNWDRWKLFWVKKSDHYFRWGTLYLHIILNVAVDLDSFICSTAAD